MQTFGGQKKTIVLFLNNIYVGVSMSTKLFASTMNEN